MVRKASIAALSAVALAACAPQETEAIPLPSFSATEAAPAPQPEAPVNAITEPDVGYDVSFPQCDLLDNGQLPEPGAFTIVGANDYLPSLPNQCADGLADWAEGSSGEAGLPKVMYYVTAANPINEQGITTWPDSGDTPYGGCNGARDKACAYQYGRDRAIADEDNIMPRPLDGSELFIDIEKEYSWGNPGDNAAMLEGMVEYFKYKGADVGIYGNAEDWDQLIGTPDARSSLHDLDAWSRGAHTLEEARRNCLQPNFTGGEGKVELAQWIPLDPENSQPVPGQLDLNVSCVKD